MTVLEASLLVDDSEARDDEVVSKAGPYSGRSPTVRIKYELRGISFEVGSGVWSNDLVPKS